MSGKPFRKFKVIVPVKAAPESLAFVTVCINELFYGASMGNVAVSAAAHQEFAPDARRALENDSPRALHIQISGQHQTRCAGSYYRYIVNIIIHI